MLSTRLTIITFLAATWCWTSDGQLLYDVACPGVNNELQCPDGQEIEVISMHYGLKSSADCTARNKPAVVSEKDCIHPLMFGFLKLICDKFQRCRLPKPNARMFLCDSSKDNFLQINYKCDNKRADVRNAVFCQDEKPFLACEKGVLNIVKASFGRFDKNTCTDTPSDMTFCASPFAGVIKSTCDGFKECRFDGNSRFLGHPRYCDKLPKYVTVDYVCQ